MPKPNNAPQGRKSLMDNRVVSILMALACGLATWLVVTIYIDPQGSTTIRDVPINYANSATTYTNQGLDIVERPDINGVTVRVEGNITSIGNFPEVTSYDTRGGLSQLFRRQRCGQGHPAPAGPRDQYHRLLRQHQVYSGKTLRYDRRRVR